MFSYDDEIAGRFPSIHAGVILASGLVNRPAALQLREQYTAEQAVVYDRLQNTPIANLPSISAWRQVFAQFGVKPTQHRSAAEALLRRLSKSGSIPNINTLVDLGNLVSIRYGMPVAVVDRAGIAGPITVRFAGGTEAFTDLGADEVSHPYPGEVIFVDPANVACARRWCWRQSAQSATSETTVEAMVVVEGHHANAKQDVGLALDDLTSLLNTYQPGSQLRSYRLSAIVPDTEFAEQIPRS
jgi:DNA/RNA-binding domain of Phe-tRNA-synthetase-like protein